MCDNNRYPSITTLHNVLLKPDLCDIFFSIIMLLNLRHTCLSQTGFCTLKFGEKDKHVVTLPHIA